MGDLIEWPIKLSAKRIKQIQEERHVLMHGPSLLLTCICGATITVYEKADINAYPFRIFHTIHKKCAPDAEYWGY